MGSVRTATARKVRARPALPIRRLRHKALLPSLEGRARTTGDPGRADRTAIAAWPSEPGSPSVPWPIACVRPVDLLTLVGRQREKIV